MLLQGCRVKVFADKLFYCISYIRRKYTHNFTPLKEQTNTNTLKVHEYSTLCASEVAFVAASWTPCHFVDAVDLK